MMFTVFQVVTHMQPGTMNALLNELLYLFSVLREFGIKEATFCSYPGLHKRLLEDNPGVNQSRLFQ